MPSSNSPTTQAVSTPCLKRALRPLRGCGAASAARPWPRTVAAHTVPVEAQHRHLRARTKQLGAACPVCRSSRQHGVLSMRLLHDGRVDALTNECSCLSFVSRHDSRPSPPPCTHTHTAGISSGAGQAPRADPPKKKPPGNPSTGFYPGLATGWVVSQRPWPPARPHWAPVLASTNRSTRRRRTRRSHAC